MNSPEGWQRDLRMGCGGAEAERQRLDDALVRQVRWMNEVDRAVEGRTPAAASCPAPDGRRIRDRNGYSVRLIANETWFEQNLPYADPVAPAERPTRDHASLRREPGAGQGHGHPRVLRLGQAGTRGGPR